MDPRTSLHEGQELQLRILRIDADRRRLGLSLRQADELDRKEAETETSSPDSGVTQAPDDMISLEQVSSRAESGEKEGSAPRQNRTERRERTDKANEGSLLGGLEESGETTAMAEAFRAAARQRSKEESEGSSE
jgi:small subunit ribosomal protein S1